MVIIGNRSCQLNALSRNFLWNYSGMSTDPGSTYYKSTPGLLWGWMRMDDRSREDKPLHNWPVKCFWSSSSHMPSGGHHMIIIWMAGQCYDSLIYACICTSINKSIFILESTQRAQTFTKETLCVCNRYGGKCLLKMDVEGGMKEESMKEGVTCISVIGVDRDL